MANLVTSHLKKNRSGQWVATDADGSQETLTSGQLRAQRLGLANPKQVKKAEHQAARQARAEQEGKKPKKPKKD